MSAVDPTGHYSIGFRLVFEGLDPSIRDEWIELGRRSFPDIARTLVDEVTVEMTGPQAFLDTMGKRLAELDG